MNMNSPEGRLEYLKELFPRMEITLEDEAHLQDRRAFEMLIFNKLEKTLNPKASGQNRVEKKRQRPPQKKLDPFTMTNSDEELELELSSALKLYKGNKKKKVRSGKNESGDSEDSQQIREGAERREKNPGVDEKLRSWLCGVPEEKSNAGTETIVPNECFDIDEMVNFFLLPRTPGKDVIKNEKPKEGKSLSDYENQGAIPKNKFDKNHRENVKKNQTRKGSAAKVGKNTVERGRFDETEKRKGFGEAKGDGGKRLDEKVFSRPFFYIVPENPSGDFFFPRGSYYVVPKARDSSVAAVFHPQQNPADDPSSPELPTDANDLTGAPQENNGDGREKSEAFGLNITPMMEIERLLSEDGSERREAGDLLAMKSVLVDKWKEASLRSVEVLKNLCKVELSLNLEHSLSSIKSFYDKNILKPLSSSEEEECFSKMVALFPETDENYLRKKLEECRGRQDLFEDLIESEFRRLENVSEGKTEMNEVFQLLLQEFPESNFEGLYELWNACMGNRDTIVQIVKQEEEDKKLETLKESLILEFPDYNEAAAKGIARDYLQDEEGLAAFIASEHMKRKVQQHFQVMTSALPDHDAQELLAKCNEFQGDEERVQEYIRKVEEENKIQSQIVNIMMILPDAKPEFLRQEIEKLEAEYGTVNNLTDQLLESQDYPKISPDEDKVFSERKRLWRIYVDNFDVKEFLYKVPHPEKFAAEFGDNNKADRELILRFLESRYPELNANELEESFINNKCNMTKTCLMLDQTEEPIILSLSAFRNEAFDEAFLQEICYIDFKREIDDYLDEAQTVRVLESEEARLNNAFLMCPLCEDEELIPSEAATCPDGHVFCKKCVFRYITIKIADGLYKFPCFSEDCDTFFTYGMLEELLPKSLLSDITKKQQAEEISKANVDGLESCPFCDYSYIPNPEDIIFMCQNVDCLAETCRKCRDKSHLPLRCEEIERPKDLEARKKIEETMTEKLVRVCPSCQKKFVKIDGCNKMTCTCGAIVCYICRKLVKGYDHFKAANSSSPGCPLYSRNEDLHTREVLEEGIRVRNDIIQQNPDIRILNDPTDTNFN